MAATYAAPTLAPLPAPESITPAAPLKVGPRGVLFSEQTPTDPSNVFPVETVLVCKDHPRGVLKDGPMRRCDMNFRMIDPLI